METVEIFKAREKGIGWATNTMRGGSRDHKKGTTEVGEKEKGFTGCLSYKERAKGRNSRRASERNPERVDF